MLSDDRPFSQAAENNKRPLLGAISPWLAKANRVLEIGSGTGQHAVFFASALPHLLWQSSELSDRLLGLQANIDEAGLANLPDPLGLDVDDRWPVVEGVDAVFTANTLHFMPWTSVERLLQQVALCLQPGNPLLIYGPFNEDGQFTSPGNRHLDGWLKAINPAFGLRDRQRVIDQAATVGLTLQFCQVLPSNNLLLAFQRD